MFKKVDSLPGYVKNINSGLVINTNKEEVAAARARKEAIKKKDKRIEELESDVLEMKNLLNKVLEKIDGTN